MQSIVSLSIRYGIITPYTSYLIEEDDIFSQAGREGIVAPSWRRQPRAAAVSGEAAVEQADTAAGLAGQKRPPSFQCLCSKAAASSRKCRTSAARPSSCVPGGCGDVDRHGFRRRQADATTGSLCQRCLLAAGCRAGAGAIPALGSRLLLIHDGSAYLIGEEGESAPLPLPSATPAGQPAGVEPDPTADQPGQRATRATPLCGAAVLPLLALGIVAGTRRRRP